MYVKGAIKDTNHPDFPHGTLAGLKRGCKCYECRRSKADYDLRRKGVTPKYTKIMGMPSDHPDYPHGTRAGYRYCKCDKCKQANNEYKAPRNTKARQCPEAKERQRELNRAYKDTEVGRAKRQAAHAERKARMKFGTECAEDRKLIELIYRNCPNGYQVDHIVPLSKGGKHHPDNLQYLPAEVNNAKRAKTDFDCAEHVVRWQDVAFDRTSTTIPQGSRGKRPEVPSTPLG
jgi:hypothetical protein